MKLFVIGATGGTGQEIVQQALARGHHVTAFVRSPATATFGQERLSVLKGNVMDENQLSEAMQNHDAIVSALGPREVFKPSSLLRDSALAATGAMQRSEVKRPAHSLSCSAFLGYTQSHCQFYPAKSYARFACHGESGARQRSRLDDRSSSASHAGTMRNVPKPGRCGSQKRFLSFPQSGCGVHARCDRAKETFSENRGHCEIAVRISMFIAYIVVTVLAAAANVFSATLDFIPYKQLR